MPQSRTPQSRKARRIIRQYLKAMTIANAADQEAEVVEYWTARATELEPKAVEAMKAIADAKAPKAKATKAKATKAPAKKAAAKVEKVAKAA